MKYVLEGIGIGVGFGVINAAIMTLQAEIEVRFWNKRKKAAAVEMQKNYKDYIGKLAGGMGKGGSDNPGAYL